MRRCRRLSYPRWIRASPFDRLSGAFVGCVLLVGIGTGCRGLPATEPLHSLRPQAPSPPEGSTTAAPPPNSSTTRGTGPGNDAVPNPVVEQPRVTDPFAPLPPLTNVPYSQTAPGTGAPAPANGADPRRIAEIQPGLPPLPPVPSGEVNATAPRLSERRVVVAPAARRSPLELVGTVRGIRRRALFRSESGLRDAGPGQVVDGWTVETIGDGTAVVVRDGVKRALDLRHDAIVSSRTVATGNRNASEQPDTAAPAQRKSRP
jgi:hypothetical protein